MGRLIGAVIAGYLATGVLIFCTDRLWGMAIPGLQSGGPTPAYYFAASLATDTLYSIFGGYLCAVIARSGVKRATIGLIVLGELMGLAATAAEWGLVPHWYSFALLVIYPPAVWIGSKLRKPAPALAA
jgi:hypothetical protein